LVRAQSRIKSLYRALGIATPGTDVYRAPPRAVAETAGIRSAVESDATLRAPRLSDRAEGASGERSSPRGSQAPDRADPGDRARLRADPKCPTGSDRRDAASVPNEAAVLELLRSGDRDAVELGLGARRSPMDSSPRDNKTN
jgi:hypothetical protein